MGGRLRRVAEIDAQGNRFRQLAIREKQPWLDAFVAFDELTANGGNLRLRALPEPLVLAAAAGKKLERIEGTLSDALKIHMRARILDLHGRSEPVMMEWDIAHFYLRRNMRVLWTKPGTRGPEFRCEGPMPTFEVECKRITRNAKESLGDREANILANGVIVALATLGFCGEFALDATLVKAPPEAMVCASVFAAVPNMDGMLDVELPGIGRLQGSARRLPAQAMDRIRRRIDEQMAAKPHDYRGFGATVPLGAPDALDSIVLWIRGPRRTQAEHVAHIEATAMEAAQQLSGAVPGLIAVEVEDVQDAALFRDKAVFRDTNARVFRDYPHVAAVLWRGDRLFEPTVDGFLPSHPAFVERNANCAFERASDIPMLDE